MPPFGPVGATIFNSTSVWQPLGPFLPIMATNHLRQVGLKNLQQKVLYSIPSLSHSPSPLPSLFLQTPSTRRNKPPFVTGICRTGPFPAQRERFLFPLFSYPKEIRQVEMYPRLEEPQQVRQTTTLQDGHTMNNYPSTGTGWFLGPRPPRCVLPYHHKHFPQVIPQIRPGVLPLPMQGSTLWPFYSVQTIFQSP